MTNTDESEKSRLDQILADAESLSLHERAELVAKILGQQSGVSIAFGNVSGNSLNGLILQITDRETLRVIVGAIAQRIER